LIIDEVCLVSGFVLVAATAPFVVFVAAPFDSPGTSAQAVSTDNPQNTMDRMIVNKNPILMRLIVIR
jgi:hypothetical protein